MKTHNSPCMEQANKNTRTVFSSIKSKVEKITSSTSGKENLGDLLDGFLAFNENFKIKRCSDKANENFDVELSEFNESNFIFSTADLGAGFTPEYVQQENWA
jgi:hypothetical protein